MCSKFRSNRSKVSLATAATHTHTHKLTFFSRYPLVVSAIGRPGYVRVPMNVEIVLESALQSPNRPVLRQSIV